MNIDIINLNVFNHWGRLVKIYLKLPNSRWILVRDRLKQVTIRGGRKTTRYVLVGETLKEEPVIDDKRFESLTMPSGKVNKFIIKLLDRKNPQDSVIVLTPIDPETYRVDVHGIKLQDVKELMDSILE
ncbi:MAG: hypothetical protein QXO80_05220 [Thermosphaera sp.]